MNEVKTVSDQLPQPLTVIPLYRQLSRLIETEIVNGRWKQGDKIASEAELSKMFAVSRITVRAALDELVDEGMLAKVQGKGTFVTNSTGKQMLTIGTSSFAEMCRRNNMQPKRIQLFKDIVEASDSDMVKLGLKHADKIISLVRVLCADGIPLMIATDHIRSDFDCLLRADLENNSLNECMLKSGLIKSLHSRERTIEICSATTKEAEALNARVGSPMLLLRDLTVDETGRPARWTKEIIAGDRVRIEYIDL